MVSLKLIAQYFVLAIFIFNNDCIAQTAVQRNILHKITNEQNLKSLLLTPEEWVPYPKYKDRAGWENFLGTYKNALISEGEKS
ncbi:hypothetical protein [Niabella ginsengisoli]|uniref:Uncharacterized protein n=1 Tax=Niabella ginsengisoli TaxID=522298 RepID=A0ABS9SNP1_9BACT|nr:hypothetical protein [Niabella ginsengisoli]MCH5599965.1 hypothetical protein [Niabella ginsengisoli]